MPHAVKAALNLANEYGSTRNHKSRNAARHPPAGAIYIRVMNGDVSGSRQYMSPAPSDVVQFLFWCLLSLIFSEFRAFDSRWRHFLASGNDVLHVPCMRHALSADMILRRGVIQHIQRENSLDGGEVVSTSPQGDDSLPTRPPYQRSPL
jgi:hypothetical protein